MIYSVVVKRWFFVHSLLFCIFLAGCGSAHSTAPTETVSEREQVTVQGSIDTPSPGAKLGSRAPVGGWAFARGGVVQEIVVFVDGKEVSRAAYGGHRPDVAKQFSSPAATNSGWHTEVDFTPFAAGEHEVTVRARLADGTEHGVGTVRIVK